MDENGEFYSSKPFCYGLLLYSNESQQFGWVGKPIAEVYRPFRRYIYIGVGKWRIRVKYKFNDASKRDGGMEEKGAAL